MVRAEGYYGWLRGWQHRRRGEFELSDVPNLKGKTALVTGSNGGIGKCAAHILAEKGARVLLACRSEARAEGAIVDIGAESPDADITFIEYDASSVQAAYRTVETFLKTQGPLHILMLNAGAIVGEPQGSKDDLEWLFAVNHLAHFALTIGLLPAIKQAAEQGDARIVVTTSAGFNMHPDPESLHIEDDELNVKNKSVWWEGAMPMYGRSKTCNILFAAELSRRLRETDWGHSVRVNAAHPGTISTGLNDSLRTSWYFTILEYLVYAFASVPTDRGALSLLYGATSDEVREKDITGKYFTPYGFVNDAPVKAAAGNPTLAKGLWERSIQLCQSLVTGFTQPETSFR